MRRVPPHRAPPERAEPRGPLLSAFAHTPRTLSLVWKASPALSLSLAATTLASAVLPLGLAWVGKRIIDSAVAHDPHRTVRYVLVELALAAGLGLATQARDLASSVLGARLSLDVNLDILEKATELELEHFEDAQFYDQLTRARREASTRPISVVRRVFSIAQALVTLAGYVALLVGYSGWVVLGLVVATIPATVAEVRFGTKVFRLKNWRSPEARKLLYLEYVLSNDEHAKEVKLFGLGPLFLDRYRKLGESFYSEDTRLNARRAAWGWALSLLSTGAFYAAYAKMAWGAAAGALTLGAMTLYMVSFRQGQQAFQGMLGALAGVYEDNLYMDNLFSFLGIAKKAAVPSPAEGADATAERGIRFEGVGFRYPGREEWTLRDLDLFIPEAESLAIVGKNGAGKTTLIKLLARLYEPTEGRILLDGRPLAAWDRDELFRRIGVIFQNYNRYQFTAKDNVGLGSVPDMDDDASVERAVELGGAGDVVRELKDGLSTQLGRWFHDGVDLSGGQWQRLALARAFMRRGADVLVLDEPTASLDAEAEHAVFERFARLTKGRTSILISHRFPTVRMADRIVVLEDGRIVEQGTHEGLVAAGGRYAKLFALQAQGYQ
jgi:ATP-binding cassette subfamily B protein